MSYQIGIDTIHLRPTPRLAHTEYCSNTALIKAVTGIEDPSQAGHRFLDAWEVDFLFCCHDGLIDWTKTGRTTDMGHAEFLENGVDLRQPKTCPFTHVAQVYEFDAVKEYGLPTMKEQVDCYEKWYQEARRLNPNQLIPGGYYKTIMSGAIQAFGWDMLLEAAADQDRFEKVLDTIYQRTLFHCQAWAQTSIEVFLCHDDMVWSQGPFMHPDFYRRVIFSRFKKIWSVLKQAGKKVLFCSDGLWSPFVDDIAEAGADGFIFEPMTALEPVVAKYGKTHAIVSSKVDCRTMTFGTKADIQAEIDATLKLAFKCPGFMFAVGNHIPSNVPVENGLFLFDYLKKHWKRK